VVINDTALAYATVFGLEAVLFILSARLAAAIREPQPEPQGNSASPGIKPNIQETAHA
jgi:hypothetical protein